MLVSRKPIKSASIARNLATTTKTI